MAKQLKSFKRIEIEDLFGDFTWDLSCRFYIETEYGALIYSDPQYGGTGELCTTTLSLDEFLHPHGHGRAKGEHRIGDYCDPFRWDEFSWVTQEMFDEELEKIVEEKASEGTLMAVPGLYEVVSEEFNNEVLERLQEKRS